jgi:hypothetical protein
MLAAATIGRMVGVKKASRSAARPAMWPLTHSAIRSDSAIDSGTVISA